MSLNNKGFNNNLDGIAPNMPCVPDCPNRNPYCRKDCTKYQEWRVTQEEYRKKVKSMRKDTGGGIRWNSLYGK